MKHEPFDELSWQYFPKPKIGHRPPVFNYGFPLEDGVSDIQHLAHATGILKSEEELNGGNLGSIMVRTLKHFNAECGLSRPDLLSVVGCYSKTARFVLTLKTNYHVRQMPPEKLKHVIDVLRRYFPGKAPQWFPDTEITSMEHQDFTIPGSFFYSLQGSRLNDPLILVEALKSLL